MIPETRSIRRLICLLWLLASVGLSAAEQPRIVAVGDVHGAFPEFVSILQRTKVIDEVRQWMNGAGVLIQTGDVPDRGTRTRECFDLLIELERQAAKHGGRVLPLLGNHEVMNMMGDLRYVSTGEYTSFATPESEKVREQAWQDYRRFLSARNSRRRQAPPADDEGARQKWLQEHPPGYFEHRDAFSPKGAYGAWLRKHDAVAHVGDVIFLHGGLDPKLKFKNVAELNDKIRKELETFDSIWQFLADKRVIWPYMRLEEALREVQDEMAAGLSDPDAVDKIQKLMTLPGWLLILSDGPLWYRGYAQQPEEKLGPELNKMLDRLKAKHVVVGHSPTASHRIVPRFDSRVFLIDTGMLQGYYRGQASALEIHNGRFTGYYSDGQQQVLLDSSAPASNAANPERHAPGAAASSQP